MKISKSDLIKLIKEEVIKLKEAVDSEPNADWAKYGPAAGPIRNKEIIDACDVVIAFWDGKSKGTANSIKLAKCKCSPLHIIRY
jgi:hypothetical protein